MNGIKPITIAIMLPITKEVPSSGSNEIRNKAGNTRYARIRTNEMKNLPIINNLYYVDLYN
ncbi:hypothetical protein GCM10008107_05590 [Psychrosphaera saromensis]|nr:hypothetical protein GCM10008107_05590 [Psychrosphaera saromensis]GLQ14280.1 hypothetical protein GCM10007917_17350 [Psychrosphaera saromensis]